MIDNVVLIHPCYNVGPVMSHGLQYISGSLTEHGVRHRIELLEHLADLPGLVARLKEERPRVIGISTTSFEYKRMRDEVAAPLHGGPSVIVFGGVHTILNPGVVDDSIDYICVAEADLTFWKLCLGLFSSDSGTPPYAGFATKDGAYGERPNIPEDFDRDLPRYLSGKMPIERITRAHDGWLNVLVSRGCPYQCSFCVNPALRKLHAGKRYCRRMSPEMAIEHLESIIDLDCGIKVFNFDDDDLTRPAAWFDRFLALYADRIFGRFGVRAVFNARPTHITPELVDALVASGCHELQMSVECGDDDTRKHVLNKPITNDSLRSAFAACRAAGLRTLAYVMHGIPFSPSDAPDRLAKLIAELKPVLVRGTYCYPLAQTELSDMCRTRQMPVREESENIFERACLPRYDGDAMRFEYLLAGQYERRPNNKNYLWRIGE